MTKAIDAKVTKRWAVVSLVFTGECIVVLIVCYGRLAYLLRLGVDVPRLAVPIAFAASAATPLFVLELVQMRAMHKQCLLLTWASSFWNQIDVLSVVWLPVMLIVAVRHGAEDSTFKIVASIGGLVLMFKLLGFLKVLSVQLATFVLALGIILSDVRSFLAVLLVVMLGFGNAFWTLLGTKTLQLHDDEPDNPFGSVGETMLTMFNMGMLGDFDRDVFGNDYYTVLLFVVFMALVVVVMLNVLIAIVSDSYENAMVRSRKLFLRSRLELAAELDQILPGGGADEDQILPGDKTAWYLRLFTGLQLVCCSPLIMVSGLLYGLTHLSAGEAAADRTLPSYLLQASGETDEDSDEWEGRVLDVEKRTKALLKPSEHKMKEMDKKLDQVQKKMDAKLDQAQKKMDSMDTKLEQLQNSNSEILQFLKALAERK